MHAFGSPVKIQKPKTMEPYRRLHEIPVASAIAQHCSPATSLILCFNFRQEKFGVLFKRVVISLSYSF
jgi:hypothetical protein